MREQINPALLQHTAEKLQLLFQDFSPVESRQNLWQLFSLTVSGGFNRKPVEQRENLLAFYEHLQQVLAVLESLWAEGEGSPKSKCPCIEKLYKSFQTSN